jgi:hypothetical protein
MSNTYADALRYFRTKLKAGPEPVVTNLTTEGVVGPQMDGLLREELAEPVQPEPEGKAARTILDESKPLTALLERIEHEERPAPEPEPWPWEHLMSYTEFQTRTPHRQKQLIAQWEENVVLGGKHALTLRGGPKNKNCFRGCPSYECLCEDNL